MLHQKRPSINTPTESNRDPAHFLDEVRGWNEAKVAEWLHTVNSAAYSTVFVENHINGSALLDCDQTALRHLGVIKVGDRVRLSVAIKALRSKCYGPPKTLSIATAIASELPSAHSTLISPATPTSATSARTVTNSTHRPNHPSPIKIKSNDKIESPMRSANAFSSLLSNCVKFIGEEGQTRIVNIGDCKEASHVLEKALKKFNLLEATTGDPAHRVDNYCVFITADVGAARQLSDEELFQICQDPNRPERERLILKQKDSAPTALEFRQAQKIAREQQALLKDTAMANNMNKLKKIGGFFGETPTHIRHGSASGLSSPLTSPIALQHPKGPRARIKEFFGGRPPSELISSNLSEYFPEASNLVLEKTVRNSIRRSQRMSTNARTPSGRRYSDASALSVASARSTATATQTVGDAWISATSLPRKSRPMSVHRTFSNMSDTDTIASKKSRRSKYAPSVRSTRSIRSTSGRSTRSEVTFREDTTSGSASENDNAMTEGEEDGPEFELPDYLKEKLAVTEADDTISHKRQSMMDMTADNIISSISNEDTGPSSWIKGTLIGQGSFGSVVLGMNQLTGELMAVKQVDLPRTNNDRELTSRKNTMLDALQREIALLRDLQHDNIVQYLGSNSDGTHLNIFL